MLMPSCIQSDPYSFIQEQHPIHTQFTMFDENQNSLGSGDSRQQNPQDSDGNRQDGNRQNGNRQGGGAASLDELIEARNASMPKPIKRI